MGQKHLAGGRYRLTSLNGLNYESTSEPHKISAVPRYLLGRSHLRDIGHLSCLHHLGHKRSSADQDIAKRRFRIAGREGFQRRVGNCGARWRVSFLDCILSSHRLLYGEPENQVHDASAYTLRYAVRRCSLSRDVLGCDAALACPQRALFTHCDCDRDSYAHDLCRAAHLSFRAPLFEVNSLAHPESLQQKSPAKSGADFF